jgi:hypothetical protein
MSDPITLGLASTAVSLVNGTIGLLKEARSSAKQSDDHDLKDKLSDVFDSVLELKEVIGNLRDENAGLRKLLDAKTNLKWDSGVKLYFAEGDPDPFCPSCLDVNGKQIRLQPSSGYHASAWWKYDCKVCNNHFVLVAPS